MKPGVVPDDDDVKRKLHSTENSTAIIAPPETFIGILGTESQEQQEMHVSTLFRTLGDWSLMVQPEMRLPRAMLTAHGRQ